MKRIKCFYLGVAISTNKIFYIKYLFIYHRSKMKLVKGNLARDEILLETSIAPFFPIFLLLKIIKEKILKSKNFLKNNSILKKIY
jgi:hypothetical protein